MVHHSDRGVQYASSNYTDLLKTNGITIGMSRGGSPYDNARCESFMKTLKYEEVYRTEYRDLAEARAQIGVFIEKVYNRKSAAADTWRWVICLRPSSRPN
jgi:transposase InsO family protein